MPFCQAKCAGTGANLALFGDVTNRYLRSEKENICPDTNELSLSLYQQQQRALHGRHRTGQNATGLRNSFLGKEGPTHADEHCEDASISSHRVHPSVMSCKVPNDQMSSVFFEPEAVPVALNESVASVSMAPGYRTPGRNSGSLNHSHELTPIPASRPRQYTTLYGLQRTPQSVGKDSHKKPHCTTDISIRSDDPPLFTDQSFSHMLESPLRDNGVTCDYSGMHVNVEDLLKGCAASTSKYTAPRREVQTDNRMQNGGRYCAPDTHDLLATRRRDVSTEGLPNDPSFSLRGSAFLPLSEGTTAVNDDDVCEATHQPMPATFEFHGVESSATAAFTMCSRKGGAVHAYPTIEYPSGHCFYNNGSTTDETLFAQPQSDGMLTEGDTQAPQVGGHDKNTKRGIKVFRGHYYPSVKSAAGSLIAVSGRRVPVDKLHLLKTEETQSLAPSARPTPNVSSIHTAPARLATCGINTRAPPRIPDNVTVESLSTKPSARRHLKWGSTSCCPAPDSIVSRPTLRHLAGENAQLTHSNSKGTQSTVAAFAPANVPYDRTSIMKMPLLVYLRFSSGIVLCFQCNVPESKLDDGTVIQQSGNYIEAHVGGTYVAHIYSTSSPYDGVQYEDAGVCTQILASDDECAKPCRPDGVILRRVDFTGNARDADRMALIDHTKKEALTVWCRLIENLVLPFTLQKVECTFDRSICVFFYRVASTCNLGSQLNASRLQELLRLQLKCKVFLKLLPTTTSLQ